jgi:uncharacterized membrane protein YeaQ/YmgE (transglycosylase-associated protein family)
MAIDPIDVLIWLVIGVIAGWLSSRVVMGGGLGPIWDLIVGIIGAVIAGYTTFVASLCGRTGMPVWTVGAATTV